MVAYLLMAETVVYSFPYYIVGIPVIVSIVSAGLGFYLYQKGGEKRLPYTLFAASLIAGVIFAPAMALDRVVLDDKKLEQTTGYWFYPTVKGFQFDEVAQINVTTIGTVKGRRERWVVVKKNGQSERIAPGDLWKTNGPDIIERLRAKGITVQVHR